jgi:hypothetical protein
VYPLEGNKSMQERKKQIKLIRVFIKDYFDKPKISFGKFVVNRNR